MKTCVVEGSRLRNRYGEIRSGLVDRDDGLHDAVSYIEVAVSHGREIHAESHHSQTLEQRWGVG